MKNKTPFQNLSRQIEQVIRDHIAASYKAAAAAVEQSFALASATRIAAPRALRPPDRTAKHRAPEEIAALSERFREVVLARPGETMSVLAAEVGASAVELISPVMYLKRAGQIRCVGARNLTRYFPLAA
jgi:hypothetical protein